MEYPLIKYTSGTIGGAGFSAFHIARGMSGILTNNLSTSSVDVILSGTNVYPLVWKGNVSTNWDVNTTTNWAFNVTPATFMNSDNVQLDDTATVASTNITLNASVTPSAFTVTNNTLNYTLAGNGALAGGIGLTKNGSASLTLLTTNTYTGVTTINGGTVSISTIASNGVASGIGMGSAGATNLVLNGGTLAYTGPTNSFDRPVLVNAGGGTISVTSNLTLNASINGNGTFTKSGPGQLTVSVNAPVTNGIVVSAGTLQLTTSDFDAAFTPSLITVNTNGTLFGNHTHATGGGTAVYLNRGTWLLNDEDYKQSITMMDGLIAPGPTPNSSGGELRVGYAGGGGSYTWYVSNSIAGSVISSPLNTIVSSIYLTLNVTRGAAASDLTIGGVIGNAGNITFTGNGITTLTNINTYTGNTTVNGGTLALSGVGSIASTPVITLTNNATLNVSNLTSPLVLGGGQTLQGSGNVLGAVSDSGGTTIIPGGTAKVGTLAFSSDLTLAGSDTLNFDLGKTSTSAGGTNNDLITVAGNLTINPGTTVNINPIQVALAGGTYKLIAYTGTLTDNSGGIATGWTTTGYTPAGRVTGIALSTGTPGEIDLIVTGSPASLVWQGDGSANAWDVQTAPNWLNGVTADEFYQLDNVLFNDSGSVSPVVDIKATVTPSSMVVSNNAKNYTFNNLTSGGNISGGTGLTKNGTGTLTILNNNNDYTGATTINNGTLALGDGANYDGALTASPIVDNATLEFNVDSSQTAATTISGSGTVVQTGNPNGTLTLNAANSWAGGLSILNGTAKPGVNYALPAGESVTVAAGAAYDFNGINNGSTTTRANSFTIAGSGPSGSGALVNSGASIQSDASVSNLTLTADATVGSTGRWDIGPATNSTINGNGHALTIYANNSGNGIDLRVQNMINVTNIQINSGNVWYESYNQTNSSTAKMTNYLASGATLGIYGSQIINVPIVSQGGTLDNQGSGTPVFSGSLDAEQPTTLSSANGSVVFAGTVTTNLYGSTSGSITLAGNNTIAFAGNDTVPLASMGWTTGTVQLGNLTPSGSVPDATITIPSGLYFTVNRSDLFTLTNNITGLGNMNVLGTNISGLVVNGSASINIGGAIYVGQSAYGKLLIQPGASITASNVYMGNPSSSVGGDAIQTGGTLITLDSSGVAFRIGHWASETSSYAMFGGNLNVAGTINVGYDGTGSLRQTNGVITTAGLTVPYRYGAGVWALEGGTITIGAAGISEGGAGTIYLGGGTVGASANWSTTAAMSLTGTNGNTTFDTGVYAITLGGALSGPGGLVATDLGTLSLTAANTYTGPTTVNSGTLLVNGSLGTNTVLVDSGATLSGLGTVNGPVVNNGTFAPGTNGIGTLSINNALTLGAGGTTTLAINRAAGTNTFGRVNPAYYVGSLTRCNFAEEKDPKGFIAYEISGTKLSDIKLIEVDCEKIFNI